MVAEERHLELIGVLNPRAIQRARWVAFAIKLLQEGEAPIEVRARLRLQYGIRQSLAWKLVDMAVDLAGPV